MEIFIFVVGLRLALGVAGLALRVLALAAEVAAAVLVLAARAAGAVLAAVAPPLARVLTERAVRVGRGGARVTRTHVGPAVLAGCEWLGYRVIAVAGAAAGGVAGAARRVLRRPPTGRES